MRRVSPVLLWLLPLLFLVVSCDQSETGLNPDPSSTANSEPDAKADPIAAYNAASALQYDEFNLGTVYPSLWFSFASTEIPTWNDKSDAFISMYIPAGAVSDEVDITLYVQSLPESEDIPLGHIVFYIKTYPVDAVFYENPIITIYYPDWETVPEDDLYSIKRYCPEYNSNGNLTTVVVDAAFEAIGTSGNPRYVNFELPFSQLREIRIEDPPAGKSDGNPKWKVGGTTP